MSDQLTPDQLLALYQTAVQQAYLDREARWARARLYLILSLGGFIGTLAVVKMEGPWYVDAIVAAAFLVQGMSSLVFSASIARREREPDGYERVRQLERWLGLIESEETPQPDRRDALRAATTTLILLTILHFGACGLTFWLTFFAPQEIPVEEEAIVWSVPSAASRSCSRCDL